MRADRIRPGDVLVVVGVEVASVFTDGGSTFVTYSDPDRAPDSFNADDDLIVAREE